MDKAKAKACDYLCGWERVDAQKEKKINYIHSTKQSSFSKAKATDNRVIIDMSLI